MLGLTKSSDGEPSCSMAVGSGRGGAALSITA